MRYLCIKARVDVDVDIDEATRSLAEQSANLHVAHICRLTFRGWCTRLNTVLEHKSEQNSYATPAEPIYTSGLCDNETVRLKLPTLYGTVSVWSRVVP